MHYIANLHLLQPNYRYGAIILYRSINMRKTRDATDCKVFKDVQSMNNIRDGNMCRRSAQKYSSLHKRLFTQQLELTVTFVLTLFFNYFKDSIIIYLILNLYIPLIYTNGHQPMHTAKTFINYSKYSTEGLPTTKLNE